MTRILTCSALFVLLGSASVSAQFNPDYMYTVTSGGGGINSDQTIMVQFSNEDGLAIQGWSFGLCHDFTEITFVAWAEGSTTMTVNNGDSPDFHAVTVLDDEGLTVGAAICFTGCAVLPPGSGYELLDVTYNLSPGEEGIFSEVAICDTLGTPLVESVVVVEGGGGEAPERESGFLEIGVEPVVFEATDATGVVSEIVSVSVLLDNPEEVEGFSYGLAHNDAIASITDIAPGAALAGFGGGNGPDFFEIELNPDGVGGGTVGCIIDFSAVEVIPIGLDQEITTHSYEVLAGGQTTSLDFVDTLGSPAVVTLVSVGGLAVFPDEEISGSVTGGGPQVPFIRRGDTNSDGSVDLSDAIFLAQWLFGVGPAGECEDIGDVNDNGVLDGLLDPIYLLEFLYQSGPAVPAPYPGCGPDPTDDTLTDCAPNQSTC